MNKRSLRALLLVDKKNKKKNEMTGVNALLKKLIIILSSIVLLLLIVLGIKNIFAITDVTVTGNKHYSDEEIMDFIASGPLEKNSIFLFLKYNNKSIKDIPFVEQMDVEILSPSSVKIVVYEKAIAGYVEYLGHYMYFDKDGIVVEGSLEKTEGVPLVTGLKFDHVVLYDKLPVEDDDVFMLILTITQLLNKYEISTDKIFFDINRNITLFFGDSRVYLGSSEFIDEKINEMRLLLPKLKGFSGVLHMENYKGDSSVFSFIKDEEPEDVPAGDLLEDGAESSDDNGDKNAGDNQSGSGDDSSVKTSE